METTVTGYCYNDKKVYTGEYQIHMHPDFLPVHVPPMMTLTSPFPIPEGQEPVWTGKSWTYQKATPIPEYVPSGEPILAPELPTE